MSRNAIYKHGLRKEMLLQIPKEKLIDVACDPLHPFSLAASDLVMDFARLETSLIQGGHQPTEYEKGLIRFAFDLCRP